MATQAKRKVQQPRTMRLVGIDGGDRFVTVARTMQAPPMPDEVVGMRIDEVVGRHICEIVKHTTPLPRGGTKTTFEMRDQDGRDVIPDLFPGARKSKAKAKKKGE